MRIKSNCGNLNVDYYPTKSILTNKIIPDCTLKVVTHKGKTQYKVLLNDKSCGDDIIKKNDSAEWTITENTKLPPQFINEREELYV